MGKNMTFWPFVMPQIFFWPDMRFELGTPAVKPLWTAPNFVDLAVHSAFSSVGHFECSQLKMFTLSLLQVKEKKRGKKQI